MKIIKNYIKIFLLMGLIVGCNQKNKVEGNIMTNKNITLTQEELKELKELSDDNLKAQILVKKAILNEVEKQKLTEEQLKKLNELKQNLEIEFFLEIQAAKKIQIKDYEILQLYKENAEKLKDANIVEIFPQLQQALYIQKVTEGKKEVVNSIIEEYKLNDELKKYSTSTVGLKSEIEVNKEIPEKKEEKSEKTE